MVRVAMITGASRGIGAATALVLAKRGYRVAVNHRANAPQAEEVVSAIAAAGGEAVKADVAVPNNVSFKLRLKTGFVGPFEPTREIPAPYRRLDACMLAAEHDLRLSRGKAS